MKQFFKNVAATIVGIFGFGIIMVILAVITLIGMMCNSSKTPSLKDNSVMVMKLQGQISDQANDDWLGQLTGNQYNNLGMNRILSAIKKAKQEDKVKGIYLETGILEHRLCHIAGNPQCSCRFQEERQMDYRIW